MEPRPCTGQEGAVIDTGQSSSDSSVGVSSIEEVVSSEDGLKDSALPKEEALEKSLTTDQEVAGRMSPEDGGCDSTVSRSECLIQSEDHSGATGDTRHDCVDVKPKIVIELEDQDRRDIENLSDEDMDPLITVDDTESQTSDLMNFDTVSYDMIHHPGAEDDDEKSNATVSSLSCDIKMDSPSKHSQGSNSSSIVNLLDLSVKETSSVAVSTSGQMSAGAVGSTTSSCPSSPSFCSVTMSSAVDESISEAFMGALQISKEKAKSVHCDYKVLSQEDLQPEDVSKMDVLKPADLESALCRETENVSLVPEDCSSKASHEGNSDAQIAALEEVSSGARCESSNATCSISSPLSNDLSHSSKEATHTGTKFDNDNISPQLSPCLNDVSEGSLSECDILKQKSDAHNGSGPLKSSEDANVESTQEQMDSKDMQESIVMSPLEMKEPQDTTEKTNESMGNFESNFEAEESHDLNTNFENSGEVNSPVHSVMSINDTTETSEILDSELKDIDCQNLHCTPDSNIETNIPVSLVISQPLVQSVLERDDNEIIGKDDIAVSSTTEETVKLDCLYEGVGSLTLVSSTSSVIATTTEDANSTPIVSSTSETVSSRSQRDVSSLQALFVNEGTSLEDNISSSTPSLVSIEKISPDTSEKIINVLQKEITDDSCDIPLGVRTPSPGDFAGLVSNCVTSEESTQLKSYDSSNEAAELSSVEATSIKIAEMTDQLRPHAGLTSFFENTCVESQSNTQFNSNELSDWPEELTKVLKIKSDVPLSESASPELKENLNSKLVLPNKSLVDVLNLGESGVLNNALQMVLTPLENLDDRTKRPTTLPDINPNKVTSEKSSGMNFSEFLGLFNSASLDSPSKTKQYNVAALDKAQQIASLLVDDILQIAIIKAEEKLIASKSLIENHVEAVQAAHILVDDVLSLASAQLNSADGSKAEISSTCDIKDGRNDFPAGLSITEDSNSQVTGNVLNSAPGPETNICDEEQLPNDVQEKTSPDQSEEKIITQIQPVSEELFLPLSNTSSEVALSANSECASEDVNLSEDSSPGDSLIGVESKEELTRTPSTENGGADSAKSSLLTTSEAGLRAEASLFVDGVLEEAVKKYEESSSSDSSPVKLRSFAPDSEFLQEEEELATPCGEMLTEHFMDFESGRNVSVFCSIPESGSEDHLLAYDRIAHTIGNREVDSDTGKSVSVFRIEEDVFYEIQRASTCTSVFESVEEEDEDMVDTTLPVEDRPEKNMQTSVSFPSYDADKLGASADPFSADCDAFEDAVGAFLTKERLARSEIRNREGEVTASDQGASEQKSDVTCRALVLRHPEYDISSSEEKKRMAEKWANGGESEVPDTPEMREKQRAIREALDSDDDVAVKLCRLALTEGGLINDALRREAWPRMLGLDPTLEVDAPSLEDLKSHPEYGQVVLDVNRSLKRFPPDIPKDRRETLQDKLTRLIMYVISKHPHLRYYQGYHDVAVTFLLVVGESIAFQIMERLSTEHLSDCMQPTMERTSYLLHFIYPLLHRLHPTLADYLERSEVGTMFCLPWFLTWFGHSLDRYQDVVRLYDHFLASPPLAPLYVAAVLVAHRADEVLAVDCDMAAIHALLSHIPDSLPLEILLRDSTDLYIKFPPESIEREVEERFRNEQDVRVQEMQARDRVQRQRALRRRRGHSQGSGSWQLAEFQDRIGGTMMVLNQWIPPWVVQQQRLSMRFLFASATFFVGFYVYSRGVDMLPYP